MPTTRILGRMLDELSYSNITLVLLPPKGTVSMVLTKLPTNDKGIPMPNVIKMYGRNLKKPNFCF